MGILLGFLFGLIMGPFMFYKYIAPNIPKDKFLPAKTFITETPTIVPTVTLAELPVDDLTSQVISYETSNYETEMEFIATPSTTKVPTVSKKPTTTPTKKPTPSPTKMPTKTPTPTPTFTPSPTPIPTVTLTSTVSQSSRTYTSQEINSYIEGSAVQYKVDANVLRHIALCESNFNSNAQSPNGLYKGLFQFSVGAWENYRKRMNLSSDVTLRTNAEEAVRTAAYVLSINQSYIWPNCVP